MLGTVGFHLVEGWSPQRQFLCHSSDINHGRLRGFAASKQSGTLLCDPDHVAWRRWGCIGCLDHSSISRQMGTRLSPGSAAASKKK
jgi:hypothetical protein